MKNLIRRLRGIRGQARGEAEGTDLQTVGENKTELVPYKRGIPLSEVGKGTVARYLPGSVIGMGVLQIFDLPVMGLSFPAMVELFLVHELGPLVIGFGLGLLALHRWLYPDSEVTGRKSFIAGFLSPMTLVLTSILARGLQLDLALVSFLVGIIMALGMYLRWLRPTPEEKRSVHYEPDEPVQLQEGSLDAT
jgi:hypothetical protein